MGGGGDMELPRDTSSPLLSILCRSHADPPKIVFNLSMFKTVTRSKCSFVATITMLSFHSFGYFRCFLLKMVICFYKHTCLNKCFTQGANKVQRNNNNRRIRTNS